MRISPFTFLLGCGVAAGYTYYVVSDRLAVANAEIAELKTVVSRVESELLGHTKYTTYITVGKQSLAEQMKLLTATVVREEGVTEVIEKSVLGLSSKGTVAIWYSVEYSFGFDLRPDSYDVRPGPTGIEIHVRRPRLVATPAVANLKYQVLSGGLFTDEKGAVIRLYEAAAKRANQQGMAMASEAPVVALCEKKLTSFLRDFLARQPGVTVVPAITVVYR